MSDDLNLIIASFFSIGVVVGFAIGVVVALVLT